MALKQVILVRKDLNMPKGKLAAQSSHASVEAVFAADEAIITQWRAEGMKKVILKVEDKEELFKYHDLAKKAKLPVALITDAGRTVLLPGTITCLAIGPEDERMIDRITGHLRMV